jgi:asparagine synthase (glutamine-hydrolysing)
MAEAMILRGPDEGGIYIDGNVGLAHRRLSIIDLTTGSQPMYSADKQCVIVFNGEIYNYQIIRQQLQNEGVSFVTTSDTEVLLNGYLYYGLDKLLALIDGMFAFAIYDKLKSKVFLVRDRFGEKPLYYMTKEDSFIFASELKAFGPLLKGQHIDKRALNQFFSLLYIPAPYTIYEGVRKLEQGTYLEISEDCQVISNRYYDLAKETTSPLDISYEDAKKKVRELVFDSVKLRMISDVPMGTFLSGGLDSSIVSCVMGQLSNKPINTFSIGYKNKFYDESNRALAVSRHIKSNHTQFTLNYDDVLDSIDDILDYYDEPFGDQSSIPTYMVAKLASQKVKMVLTGDAADEIWGGYTKYRKFELTRRFASYPKSLRQMAGLMLTHFPRNKRTGDITRKLNRALELTFYDEASGYYNLNNWSDMERMSLLREDYYSDICTEFSDRYLRCSGTFFQKESVWDIVTQLEGQMLPKVDRACMHNSLENRTPFLDKRLVALALSLPDKFKVDGNMKKKILWDAFSDILPQEIIHLPKKGFGVPINQWLKKELKGKLESVISRDFIESQGIFNYEYIEKLYADHLSGLFNNGYILWRIYAFQKWYNSKKI